LLWNPNTTCVDPRVQINKPFFKSFEDNLPSALHHYLLLPLSSASENSL